MQLGQESPMLPLAGNTKIVAAVGHNDASSAAASAVLDAIATQGTELLCYTSTSSPMSRLSVPENRC